MAMIRAAAAVALLVVLAMALQGAQAQCPSVLSLLSCEKAVTNPNTMPTEACCLKVKETLEGANGAKCLCDALTSKTAVDVGVIKGLAVLLPSECEKLIGLKYIKNYKCGDTNVP